MAAPIHAERNLRPLSLPPEIPATEDRYTIRCFASDNANFGLFLGLLRSAIEVIEASHPSPGEIQSCTAIDGQFKRIQHPANDFPRLVTRVRKRRCNPYFEAIGCRSDSPLKPMIFTPVEFSGATEFWKYAGTLLAQFAVQWLSITLSA